MLNPRPIAAFLLLALIEASCAAAPPEFERKNSSEQKDSDVDADADATAEGNGKDTDDTKDDRNAETPDVVTPSPDPAMEVPDPVKEVEVIPKPDPGMEPIKDPEPPVVVYSPCPALGQDCKIMPLGDSITWGVAGYENGGYRVPLIKKAWAANKKITFVGETQTGPAKVDNKDFPRANEGHSGWTIDDIGDRNGISKIIVASLAKHKPHIVTLQIGTNDTNVNIDAENIPKRLGNLIDTIIMHSPNTLIVVAQIVPSRNAAHDLRVKAYNSKIPELVKIRADAGKHVVLVDMYGAVTVNANWKSEYFQDDLHPKNAGFDVMANVWWDAIQSHLK